MSRADISVIRIDPEKRTVAKLVMKGRADHSGDIKRMIKSNSIGWFELVTIGNVRLTEKHMINGEEKTFDRGACPLMVAARDTAPKDLPGWKLECRDVSTAGQSVLFGMSPEKRIIDCPVDADWVLENITWLTSEECVSSETTEQRIEI